MTNTDRIIELNTIWYELICSEYHKDRDCHFRISQHFFYGDQVEWEVEHCGYILHDLDNVVFSTKEEAENHLIDKILKYGILQEIDFYIEHYGEEGWDQHARYDINKLKDLRERTLKI